MALGTAVGRSCIHRNSNCRTPSAGAGRGFPVALDKKGYLTRSFTH